MLDEAKLVFPDRHVGCIISVGTGQTHAASISRSRRISWASSSDSTLALQRIAADSEETAQQLQVRFRDTPDVYFRFNVEQGLQDTGMTDLEKLSEVAAHARHSNQLVEVNAKLTNAAKAAVSGGALIPAAQLDGAIARVAPRARIKGCPPASIIFTGRSDALTLMEDYFMDDPATNVRHIFVLHGLGGSGKTQIALRFVETHRDRFWDVFYVDASSDETISADLKMIALVKGAGSTADDALTWLAAQDEKWLIVFNNADNTSLDLQRYFPTCQVLKPCQISGMQPEDAQKLLLRASGMAFEDTTDEHSVILVEELGYLALAIIQAGAYIRVNECTLDEYLAMYRKNKLVLEESRKIVLKSDDYSWTVYTTWRISYDQLEHRVAKFLHLLGFLHHEGITESIFQNACECLPSYQPELISTTEELVAKQSVTEFLKSSFCAADGSFDKPAFLDFIRELRSYSLIDFDPFDRTYSVHSLLQDWVRRVAVDTGSGSSHPSTAMLLALAIRYDPDSSRHATQRLLPHVDEVLTDFQIMPCTANAFAWVYQQHNLWQSAEPLLSLSLDASKRILGEAHPTTIYNIENLATTLSRQERWPEAETLRQQAVEACQQTLGAEHTQTLWAVNNLALHYAKQGQYQKAENLQLRIVEAKKRAVGATHPDTLRAVGNLAITYADLNQPEKATQLQKSVYNAFKTLAGPRHPDTLTSMQHLAITLAKANKWDESLALQGQVISGRSTIFGRDHHDTRESIAISQQLQRSAPKLIPIPNDSDTSESESTDYPSSPEENDEPLLARTSPEPDLRNNIQMCMNPDAGGADSIGAHNINPSPGIASVNPFSLDSPIYGHASNAGLNVPQPRSPLLPKLVRPKSPFTNRSRRNSSTSTNTSRVPNNPHEPTTKAEPSKGPESTSLMGESPRTPPARKNSYTVVVESDSDEDDWTTGRSVK
ncbi:hypothetical protein FRC07_007991 [Ceratobasidium sp. 392]|nr:hypothetical protein FRC07_007991 [Ceratobasidium sp. 392]